ncbi:TPA: hypothetical protein PP061_000667 [Salmonella bongori]|nr:helix-turn-helix domain-containing protein [Salmonella bongori]ECC8731521.1 hypothetical protein [Salmonella bongori]ECE6545964.1 hypothetical protein [Salmonella bongori]ECI3517016.1 hypothetical protein [Salmonella bongori]EDP8574984.1 hypothetical protein [Salmonella bongori]EDP8593381.1 hypothetical protein [Salmonella bongori]
MAKTDGDRTRVAVMLGISVTTLWHKRKEYPLNG